jgi:hypothetical protein
MVFLSKTLHEIQKNSEVGAYIVSARNGYIV